MCLQPCVIVNPTAKRLCSFGDNFYYGGVKVSKNNFICHAYFDKPIYNGSFDWAQSVCASSFFFVKGVKIPLYFPAPCGHCMDCIRSKASQVRQRLLFEASDYPNIIFFTLTYDDNNLPVDGLMPSDVQKFFKRFRINLKRKFGYDVPFRHFYVGEYGKRTRRAHYHGLLFFEDFPPKDVLCSILNKYHGILKTSWNKGFVEVSISRNPVATARYCAKYITKQIYNNPPVGKNPQFYRNSVRHGGLGCSKLIEHQDDILNSTDGTIQLRIKNQVVTARIPSSIKRKLFPSFSSLLPKFDTELLALVQMRNYILHHLDNYVLNKEDFFTRSRTLTALVHSFTPYIALDSELNKFAPMPFVSDFSIKLDNLVNKVLDLFPNFDLPSYLAVCCRKSAYENSLKTPNLSEDEIYSRSLNYVNNVRNSMNYDE